MRSLFSILIGFAAGFVLATVALQSPGTRVVERYQDGALRAEYSTDSAGRLHGRYVEYGESGRVTVRAKFEHGLSVGASEHYDDAGELVEAIATE